MGFAIDLEAHLRMRDLVLPRRLACKTSGPPESGVSHGVIIRVLDFFLLLRISVCEGKYRSAANGMSRLGRVSRKYCRAAG